MLNLVIEAFSKAVSEVEALNAARIERLSNAWTEANEGLKPTVDCDGRFHAPCDGYQLPIHIDYLKDYDGVYFQKGQYLPTALTGHEDADFRISKKSEKLQNKYMPKHKIKVNADLAEGILKSLNGNDFIIFSKGQSWEVNGENICYLYMASYSQLVLNKFVTAVESSIKNDAKQSYSGNAVQGKVTVKGKIVNITISTTQLSFNTFVDTLKVLIHLDNDSLCYGTLPKALSDAQVGDNVEFTATFTASEKDAYMSYYKRPSKALIISKNAQAVQTANTLQDVEAVQAVETLQTTEVQENSAVNAVNEAIASTNNMNSTAILNDTASTLNSTASTLAQHEQQQIEQLGFVIDKGRLKALRDAFKQHYSIKQVSEHVMLLMAAGEIEAMNSYCEQVLFLEQTINDYCKIACI